MATTDIELKKLNKNVDDAVKILKVAYGNSAQIQNMNEKQKEAVNKLLMVGDQAEEELKKQRKFTERQRDESGKFISKQEKQSKDTSKKFLGVAQSMGGIITSSFKGSMNLAKRAWSGISTHFSNFFSQLKSQFLGLFGEESEWFAIIGSLKDSVMGFFGWIKTGFMNIFMKTPKWAKKTVDLLSSMYAIQLAEMKKGMLGDPKAKKKLGFLGILGAALFLGAAFLAAYIKKRILAILAIFKAMGVGKLFTALKLRFVGFFTKLTKFFTFLQKLPIIGKVIRGLKAGIGKLFWPLTILLTVIDFIKGFMSTKGDILDKIFGGIKLALMGFLEFPAYALGWAVEKIMGWLGMQDLVPEGGMGNRFVEVLGSVMDWLIEKVKFGLRESGAFIAGIGEKMGDFLKELNPLQQMKNFFDLLTGLWDGLMEWIRSHPLLANALGVDITEFNAPKPMPKVDLADYTSAHERRKIEIQNQKDSDMKKKINESTMATKEASEASKASTNAITSISSNKGGNGGTVIEAKQIQDELDNNMINIKNMGWEMGS